MKTRIPKRRRKRMMNQLMCLGVKEDLNLKTKNQQRLKHTITAWCRIARPTPLKQLKEDTVAVTVSVVAAPAMIKIKVTPMKMMTWVRGLMTWKTLLMTWLIKCSIQMQHQSRDQKTSELAWTNLRTRKQALTTNQIHLKSRDQKTSELAWTNLRTRKLALTTNQRAV